MGRREPDGLVEADRVAPALVGGELHQPAAVFPGYADRPLDHRLAQALAALVPRDPDPLDFAPGACRAC